MANLGIPGSGVLDSRRASVLNSGQEAAEAFRRMDALSRLSKRSTAVPKKRNIVHQELNAPLVADLAAYVLKRCTAFTRFLDDGRIYVQHLRQKVTGTRSSPDTFGAN